MHILEKITYKEEVKEGDVLFFHPGKNDSIVSDTKPITILRNKDNHIGFMKILEVEKRDNCYLVIASHVDIFSNLPFRYPLPNINSTNAISFYEISLKRVIGYKYICPCNRKLLLAIEYDNKNNIISKKIFAYIEAVCRFRELHISEDVLNKYFEIDMPVSKNVYSILTLINSDLKEIKIYYLLNEELKISNFAIHPNDKYFKIKINENELNRYLKHCENTYNILGYSTISSELISHNSVAM